MRIEPNTFIYADSNEVLRDIPDGFCDLCLTDPPYGIGVSVNGRVGSGASSAKWPSGGSRDYGSQTWDLSTISANAFEEIRRVSKQQIVWGGNYYAGILGGSNGWLVWDKGNDNPSMSDCELAWTSTGAAVKKFNHLWAGFRQQAGLIEQRYHPTQKPVPLFVWCILRYSQPGDLVIDPFCGSGTTALECHKQDVGLFVSTVSKSTLTSRSKDTKTLLRSKTYSKTRPQNNAERLPNRQATATMRRRCIMKYVDGQTRLICIH